MNVLDHLEKLAILIAISESGSLRQAAWRLNISQPAVTRSLKILERACGGELVRRTQKGATLTPRGYSTLALAKEVNDCVYRHQSNLKSFDKELNGKIEIGTYESIAVYYWPSILRELQTALPQVQISLRTGRSEALEKSVLKGEVDFIVSVSPKKHRGLASVELYRDHFELYVLNGVNPTAMSTVIAFHEAIANFETTVRASLEKYGPHVKRRITTDSFEVVRAMTAGGVGIGVMPTRIASATFFQQQGASLIPITGGAMKGASEHVIAASYLESRKEHPLIRSMLKMIQAKFAVISH
jgi:DNA-binding transcriptional LysR family regulator